MLWLHLCVHLSVTVSADASTLSSGPAVLSSEPFCCWGCPWSLLFDLLKSSLPVFQFLDSIAIIYWIPLSFVKIFYLFFENYMQYTIYLDHILLHFFLTPVLRTPFTFVSQLLFFFFLTYWDQLVPPEHAWVWEHPLDHGTLTRGHILQRKVTLKNKLKSK